MFAGMTTPHAISLAIHIGAGAVGISLGTLQLLRTKGGARHQRTGRMFMFVALIVTGSALIGTIAFRFMPLFAVLTLLVTYVAVGGWRAARTRASGPQRIDLAWTILGLCTALALVPGAPHVGSSRPVVVWSSLGALGVVLAYDFLRWTFPRRLFARLWLPEHIYKIVSALSGMVSAFAGNVVQWGQPWSQVAPSVIGIIVILYWWWRSSSLVAANAGQDIQQLILARMPKRHL